MLSSTLCATDITYRMTDCLRTNYALDQQYVDSVLTKLQPLIEDANHHEMLEDFIALSAKILQNNGAVRAEHQVLPADDAVIAAPDYHEALCENETVRIIWGISSHGDTEPMHRHYWKSILIMLQAGRFDIQYADGSNEVSDDPVGVYELPADTQAAQYKNVGNQCSFLRFEVKLN